MAQLVVRNLDDDIKRRLQRRARGNGRSMEEEVREILRRSVQSEGADARGLGTRIADRFAKIGLRPGEEIEELRSGAPRPAEFE
jgi:plasmid stability protein